MNGNLAEFRKNHFFVLPILNSFISKNGVLQFKSLCDPLKVIFGFYVKSINFFI